MDPKALRQVFLPQAEEKAEKGEGAAGIRIEGAIHQLHGANAVFRQEKHLLRGALQVKKAHAALPPRKAKGAPKGASARGFKICDFVLN